jgi:hypothetical protein
MSEPVLPGMEDWVPEDDSVNEEYVEDYTTESGQIWRVVAEDGETQWSKTSARFRKPYYSSEKGAKLALHYFPEGSRIEVGEVTWRRL